MGLLKKITIFEPMELIQVKQIRGKSFIDLYGNTYKFCSKCNQLKMDYQLCKDLRNICGYSNICRSCSYKLDKRDNKTRLKQIRERIKIRDKDIIEQRKNEIRDKKLKGQKTDIYIKTCILTDKLFVTKDPNQTYIKGLNIKGDYSTQYTLVNNILKYGCKHKCQYCFNMFDLRNNGKICNKGNEVIKAIAFYCSFNCMKLDTKQTIRIYHRKRRALLRKTKVEVIRDNEIYLRDKYKCYLCGVKVVQHKDKQNSNYDNTATLDHVIPLSKGGTHTKDNIKTCCRKCNSLKRDTILKGTQINIFSYASV